MAKDKAPESLSCSVETTLNVIGGRWKVLIIYFLLQETMRFGQLSRALQGISARTLSKQLRELEADGVISRKDYQSIPPRVDYSLTARGASLQPILEAMDTWGKEVEQGRQAL